MKKISMAIVVALVVAIAGSAMAFDLKGAVKKAGTKAVKGAAASGINSQLSAYQCYWDTASNNVSSCKNVKKNKNADLNAIAGILSSGRGALESQGADAEVNVHCSQYNNCKKVGERLKTMGVDGWDINYKTNKSLGNTITFSMNVK